MLIVDTREQKWGHVKSYFDRAGIQYNVHKLEYGDYMIPGRSLSIDRKQDINELASNLCTSDSRRFWNEIRNAHKAGIRIVILCEHGEGYCQARDVIKWKSPYSKITGDMVFQAMFRASAAYGVEFLFCEKAQTGQRILDILGVDHGKV